MSDQIGDIQQASTQIAFGKKARYLSPNSVKFTLFPNCQEECQIEQIFCIQQSRLVFMLEIIFYLLTGGIGFLILFWIPQWRFKLFFKVVEAKRSTGVAIFGPDDDLQIISYMKSKSIPTESMIFQYRFQRYILQDGKFVPFFENPFEMKNSELNKFSQDNQFDITRIVTSVLKNGQNSTDVPDRGLLVLCMLEFFTPFYFFQIGSCILWFFEQYIYYAYIILCTAFIGFVLKIYEERTNFLRLKKFSYQRYSVHVQRGGEEKQILNHEVIFGDIMLMKKGEIVCCDMIVIQGSAIVNESMLTGESIPIVKTPLPNNEEKFQENKQCIIYSGSIILQTSNLKCQAFRLGFETLRGNLIRSIMYPKKHSQISFSSDALYFIFIMGFAAIVSFFVSLPTFLQKLDDGMIEKVDVIIRCCDLLTISVPPALPTCLSFGISFSMRRFAKKQIYCINSQKINVCGIVRTICFDKTGTLTESLLSYKMVSGFLQGKFEDSVNSSSLSKMVRVILGSCHSLQLFNGTTAGDPLDQEMFNSSGWVISEKTEEQLVAEGNGVKKEILSADLKDRIEILETHQFESEYERMSTIVRFEGEFYILCKGAPERLRTICVPESIPSGQGELSYAGKLNSFTKQGYRVISLCYKKIDAGSIKKSRIELEQGLTYAGFLIFENKLKPETIPNIKLLQQSKVQIHMVTGDNPQTSLNIAKQCNILNPEITVPILDYINHRITVEVDGIVNEIEDIDSIITDTSAEYVITGNFFNKFCVDDRQEDNIKRLHFLLYMVKVYARMKPGQKQSLIRLMQKFSNKRGYTFIGMCGDGANDCQALKDADMGISLGDTEASIAASFTSKILNISVIEYTLREGRCCLTTSFQCFKFMALYSMIQVSTTAIEYHRGVIPADFQFLYWDLFIILPLAFLLGLTEASNKLHVEQPSHRLFSPSNIVSVTGLGFIQLIFLVITIAITATQDWYIDPITYQNKSGLDPTQLLMNSFDNSVLFWTSNFQYLFCLVGFSVGSVHKKPFWTNFYFTGYLIIIFGLSIYLLFTTDSDVNNFFQLMPDLTNVNDNSVISSMKYSWRFAVLGIIILNTIITIVFEKYVCRWIVRAIENKFPNLTYSGVSSVVVKKNLKSVDDNQSLKLEQPSAEVDQINK